MLIYDILFSEQICLASGFDTTHALTLFHLNISQCFTWGTEYIGAG